MKTIKYLTLRLMAVAAIAIAFALPAKAQVTPFTYFNVDWQFNAPISNNFANKASGWGMNFEGGYYVLPDLSIGAFINYHTNNEYISRQTLPISNSAALTTDQQHSVFQLPFGFATHYRFSDGACQPYIGLKLGANYTKMSSDFYIYEVKDNTWGFYVSPEVGVNIYPWTNSIGFHLAAFCRHTPPVLLPDTLPRFPECSSYNVIYAPDLPRNPLRSSEAGPLPSSDVFLFQGKSALR